MKWGARRERSRYGAGDVNQDGVVAIRRASPADAAAVAVLLAELGYPMDVTAASHRIEQLRAQARTSLFVAESNGEVIGLAGLHVMRVLEYADRVGVMIALVVRTDQRCRGGHEGCFASVRHLGRPFDECLARPLEPAPTGGVLDWV